MIWVLWMFMSLLQALFQFRRSEAGNPNLEAQAMWRKNSCHLSVLGFWVWNLTHSAKTILQNNRSPSHSAKSGPVLVTCHLQSKVSGFSAQQYHHHSIWWLQMVFQVPQYKKVSQKATKLRAPLIFWLARKARITGELPHWTALSIVFSGCQALGHCSHRRELVQGWWQSTSFQAVRRCKISEAITRIIMATTHPHHSAVNCWSQSCRKPLLPSSSRFDPTLSSHGLNSRAFGLGSTGNASHCHLLHWLRLSRFDHSYYSSNQHLLDWSFSKSNMGLS